MKLFLKIVLLAIFATLVVFSNDDRKPKRIDLSDPDVKKYMTDEIANNIMPLINNNGTNYKISNLMDAWILVKLILKTLII